MTVNETGGSGQFALQKFRPPMSQMGQNPNLPHCNIDARFHLNKQTPTGRVRCDAMCQVSSRGILSEQRQVDFNLYCRAKVKCTPGLFANGAIVRLVLLLSGTAFNQSHPLAASKAKSCQLRRPKPFDHAFPLAGCSKLVIP
jgi:hypothetical protein